MSGMINEIDVRKLWTELDVYEKELATESEVLEEVWVSIAELRKKNEDEVKTMGSIPELDFLHQDTVIVLNVGGQIFETTVAVLTADPFSVLACLCRRDCPVPHQGGGEAAAATDLLLSSQPREFFLDRDWWIFRHVLSFLRSDLLPSDLDTLKELYKEAIYYRIQSLQKAIENFPMNQVQES